MTEYMKQLHPYINVYGNKIPNLPANSQYAGVIVEPRCHPDLELVLKNFAYMLPTWSLYVYHSDENADYVKRICGSNHNVHMIRISVGNIDIAMYNRLLLLPTFYDSIGAEKVLVFQTDSFIRRYGIEQYLSYDYVGAPWDEYIKNPIYLSVDGTSQSYMEPVGNGGFSLRTVSVMRRFCDTYIPLYIDEMKKGTFRGLNEDLFYSYCMNVDKDVKKCPVDVATSFSVESIYHPNPYGWHKPWHYPAWHSVADGWSILKSINLT